RRIGDHGVADPVPHARDAGAAPLRPLRGVERDRRFAGRSPGGPQRVEARPQPSARLQHLPRRGRVAGGECIAVAKLERVDAALRRELVDQQLAEQRRLRNAPATLSCVSTARVSARTFGTRYGPLAWIGTRLATVGPHEAYGPVLKSPAKSNATSAPAASHAARARSSAGCR